MVMGTVSLECCRGSHQSGYCIDEVGPGIELYQVLHVRMRACLTRKARRMRTAKQMHGFMYEVHLCVCVASHLKIVSISLVSQQHGVSLGSSFTEPPHSISVVKKSK